MLPQSFLKQAWIMVRKRPVDYKHLVAVISHSIDECAEIEIRDDLRPITVLWVEIEPDAVFFEDSDPMMMIVANEGVMEPGNRLNLKFTSYPYSCFFGFARTPTLLHRSAETLLRSPGCWNCHLDRHCGNRRSFGYKLNLTMLVVPKSARSCFSRLIPTWERVIWYKIRLEFEFLKIFTSS